MKPVMTLAELKADAAEGCISNQESIKAILTALANLPDREIFTNANKDFDPLTELKLVTEISRNSECLFHEIAYAVFKETVYATAKSHIKDIEPYRCNMKALSLLSQLPNQYMPKLRTAKEG